MKTIDKPKATAQTAVSAFDRQFSSVIKTLGKKLYEQAKQQSVVATQETKTHTNAVKNLGKIMHKQNMNKQD